MRAIPDTGPGLSGFLAHWLWQVYVYFPSEGSWDWLLLLGFLMLAVNLLFLPTAWKCVALDIDYLARQKSQGVGGLIGLPLGLWNITWCICFIWFFNTPAGATLMVGHRAHLETDGHFGVRTVLVLGAAALMVMTAALPSTVQNDLSGSGTAPFKDRSYARLYLGGGRFCWKPSWNNLQIVIPALGAAGYVCLFVIALNVCYWYWSTVSLILMLCFMVGALAMDGVRMAFVAFQHRRAFG